MLTVHHLSRSQSDRIVWLCEELAIPYRMERYERDRQTGMAPEAYRLLHPAGTAPVITDGDLVLAEFGAIVEYIIARHGEGRLSVPASSEHFGQYLFWFHFAGSSAMPAAMIHGVVGLMGGSDSTIVAALTARWARVFEMLEQRLGEAPHLAGPEFTAADVMMLFPLVRMRGFAPFDLTSFPNIRNYLKKISERPAFQAAMAKADPALGLQLD